METTTVDVVVIGAGMAGAVAARDLADRGLSVAVVEGGDRVGGRLYSRRFAGRAELIECGGGWVNRDLNPLMSAEIDRYGIEMKDEDETGAGFAFRRADGMHRTPVPAEQFAHLEAAWFHIHAAARRISVGQPLSQQALSDLDVTMSEFLAPLGLPQDTRDFLDANLAAFTGAHPDEQSVLWTLSKVAAFGYSPIGLFNGQATGSEHTQMFADGASALVEAIVQGSGASLTLGDPVCSIDRTREGVVVTTRSGMEVQGRACVLATPTNVVRTLDIAPPLAEEKRALLSSNHVGRAIKVYAVVHGLASADICLGAGPFQMVLPAARLGSESWMLTCFGADPVHPVDPTSVAEVQQALRWYYPAIVVTAVDGHDWNADRLFDGTYRINRPGEDLVAPDALSAPEDRLVLANSEIDRSIWRNSMEGAVHSGKVAASHVLSVLGGGARRARPHEEAPA